MSETTESPGMGFAEAVRKAEAARADTATAAPPPLPEALTTEWCAPYHLILTLTNEESKEPIGMRGRLLLPVRMTESELFDLALLTMRHCFYEKQGVDFDPARYLVTYYRLVPDLPSWPRNDRLQEVAETAITGGMVGLTLAVCNGLGWTSLPWWVVGLSPLLVASGLLLAMFIALGVVSWTRSGS